QMVDEWLELLLSDHGNERVADIRTELQATMDANAQVFRTDETLNKALTDVRALKERYNHIAVHDKGKRFISDLIEAIAHGYMREASEFGILHEQAEDTDFGSINRIETRGGHAREDYSERDDENYMVHTMAYKEGDGLLSDIRLDYKPVVQTRYEPMERKY